jgi:death-on-curing protein
VSFRFPDIEDIVDLNRLQIDLYGGLTLGENFLNEGALDSALGLIEYGVFGEDQYPTLAEKAAYLLERIVCAHVFRDGNKRTGLMAAIMLIESNGHSFRLEEPTDQGAIDFIYELADHKKTYEDVVEWVKGRMT